MMMLMANEAMKMVMMSKVEAAGHWAEESKVSLGSKCHFSFLSPQHILFTRTDRHLCSPKNTSFQILDVRSSKGDFRA